MSLIPRYVFTWQSWTKAKRRFATSKRLPIPSWSTARTCFRLPISSPTVVLHYRSKGLKGFPQFVPALVALYASGGHIGDRLNPLVEYRKLNALEIRLDGRDFPYQFAFSAVKHSTNANKGIIFGNENLSVVLDFRGPNVQERYHWGFSGLPRVVGCFLGRVLPVSSVTSGLQDVQAVANRTTSKGRDNQSRVFSAWHVVWVCLSGCLGWIAYGLVREWRDRREARSLEKPYRIGGNTVFRLLIPPGRSTRTPGRSGCTPGRSTRTPGRSARTFGRSSSHVRKVNAHAR